MSTFIRSILVIPYFCINVSNLILLTVIFLEVVPKLSSICLVTIDEMRELSPSTNNSSSPSKLDIADPTTFMLDSLPYVLFKICNAIIFGSTR